MRALVVFDSKHGTTREIARRLADALGDGAETFELGGRDTAPLEEFDAVVLGGPVYAGSWSRRASAFARENRGALGRKRFAAFSAGFTIGEGPALLKAALPPELSGSALALAGLGGAFIMARMGVFERLIAKAVAKVSSDASSVDEKAILALAESVKGGSR